MAQTDLRGVGNCSPPIGLDLGLVDIPQSLFYTIGLFLDLPSYLHLGATTSCFGQIMSPGFLKGFFIERHRRLCRYRDHFRVCEMLSIKISCRNTIKIVYRHRDGESATDLDDFASFERVFPRKNDPMALPRLVEKQHLNTGTVYLYELGPLFYPRPDLLVGCQLDAMDDAGVWYEARVVQMHADRVLVRFCGWGSSWDTWFMKESMHLAPFRTFTVPWRNHLEVGSRLEFRRPHLPEPYRWHPGVIEYFDSLRQTILIRPLLGFFPQLLTVKTDSELICPVGTHTPSNNDEGYRQRFYCLRVPQWRRRALTKTDKRVSASICYHSDEVRVRLFVD